MWWWFERVRSTNKDAPVVSSDMMNQPSFREQQEWRQKPSVLDEHQSLSSPDFDRVQQLLTHQYLDDVSKVIGWDDTIAAQSLNHFFAKGRRMHMLNGMTVAEIRTGIRSFLHSYMWVKVTNPTLIADMIYLSVEKQKIAFNEQAQQSVLAKKHKVFENLLSHKSDTGVNDRKKWLITDRTLLINKVQELWMVGLWEETWVLTDMTKTYDNELLEHAAFTLIDESFDAKKLVVYKEQISKKHIAQGESVEEIDQELLVIEAKLLAVEQSDQLTEEEKDFYRMSLQLEQLQHEHDVIEHELASLTYLEDEYFHEQRVLDNDRSREWSDSASLRDANALVAQNNNIQSFIKQQSIDEDYYDNKSLFPKTHQAFVDAWSSEDEQLNHDQADQRLKAVESISEQEELHACLSCYVKLLAQSMHINVDPEQQETLAEQLSIDPQHGLQCEWGLLSFVGHMAWWEQISLTINITTGDVMTTESMRRDPSGMVSYNMGSWLDTVLQNISVPPLDQLQNKIREDVNPDTLARGIFDPEHPDEFLDQYHDSFAREAEKSLNRQRKQLYVGTIEKALSKNMAQWMVLSTLKEHFFPRSLGVAWQFDPQHNTQMNLMMTSLEETIDFYQQQWQLWQFVRVWNTFSNRFLPVFETESLWASWGDFQWSACYSLFNSESRRDDDQQLVSNPWAVRENGLLSFLNIFTRADSTNKQSVQQQDAVASHRVLDLDVMDNFMYKVMGSPSNPDLAISQIREPRFVKNYQQLQHRVDGDENEREKKFDQAYG